MMRALVSAVIFAGLFFGDADPYRRRGLLGSTFVDVDASWVRTVPRRLGTVFHSRLTRGGEEAGGAGMLDVEATRFHGRVNVESHAFALAWIRAATMFPILDMRDGCVAFRGGEGDDRSCARLSYSRKGAMAFVRANGGLGGLVPNREGECWGVAYSKAGSPSASHTDISLSSALSVLRIGAPLHCGDESPTRRLSVRARSGSPDSRRGRRGLLTRRGGVHGNWCDIFDNVFFFSVLRQTTDGRRKEGKERRKECVSDLCPELSSSEALICSCKITWFVGQCGRTKQVAL